jgi:hypothetical protein
MLVAIVIAPGHAGLGHDEGLLLVEAGVQHREMRHGRPVPGRLVERLQGLGLLEVDLGEAVALEELGEVLRLLDRGGADEDRLAAAGRGLDLADDAFVLLLRGPVDLVVVVERETGRLVGISTTSRL